MHPDHAGNAKLQGLTSQLRLTGEQYNVALVCCPLLESNVNLIYRADRVLYCESNEAHFSYIVLTCPLQGECLFYDPSQVCSCKCAWFAAHTLYQQSGPEEIQAIALATGDHGTYQFSPPTKL